MSIEKARKLFGQNQLRYTSIEDLCKNIVDKYNLQEKVNERIKKENADLKSGIWEKEALQDMKDEYDRMKDEYYRGFPISAREAEAIAGWQEKHDEVEHKNLTHYYGASGGAYSYTFVPTSIGVSGVCYCGICEARAMEAAACHNGHFDKAIYSQYLEEHDGSFEFQEIG